jgi:hypothetical protein
MLPVIRTPLTVAYSSPWSTSADRGRPAVTLAACREAASIGV